MAGLKFAPPQTLVGAGATVDTHGRAPLHAEPESCFRQALDVAHHQQAKSLELRAAVSLSRLWQQQGECDAARGLLAEVYSWFTEGFDTADLRGAGALLSDLSKGARQGRKSP
jgi:predicted ATPase